MGGIGKDPGVNIGLVTFRDLKPGGIDAIGQLIGPQIPGTRDIVEADMRFAEKGLAIGQPDIRGPALQQMGGVDLDAAGQNLGGL